MQRYAFEPILKSNHILMLSRCNLTCAEQCTQKCIIIYKWRPQADNNNNNYDIFYTILINNYTYVIQN